MNILIELVDNNELCLTKNDKINLDTTYGLIQESILKSINLFIYTIENIQIVFLDGIKKIIGDKDCLFKDSFSFDKNTIKKFLVLKRFRDKNGNETYFEFKRPKPNKEQCLKVTQKHLLIHCMTKKHFPQVKTHYGMAYNPNGENNQYNHSFSKTFLDIKHHVMIGKNLWDYLGGDGTYEELLQIYKKVGKDTAMKLINEILKP